MRALVSCLLFGAVLGLLLGVLLVVAGSDAAASEPAASSRALR